MEKRSVRSRLNREGPQEPEPLPAKSQTQPQPSPQPSAQDLQPLNEPRSDLRTIGKFASSSSLSAQTNLPSVIEYDPFSAEAAVVTSALSPPCCMNHQCQAQMNCFNKVVEGRMLCAFCKTQSVLPEHYLKDLDQQRGAIESSTCYQLLLEGVSPQELQILLAVDTSAQSQDYGALSASASGLEAWVSSFPEETLPFKVALLTFDSMFTVYEFQANIPQRTVFAPASANAIEFPHLFTNSREAVLQALSDLVTFSARQKRKGANLSAVYSLSRTLLRFGGVICLFLASEQASKDPLLLQPPHGSKQDINVFSCRNMKISHQIPEFVKCGVTLSCFCFSRGYKGVVGLSQVIKQTNGWLCVYEVDDEDELTRSYYDISFYLGGLRGAGAQTFFTFSEGHKISSVYAPSHYLKTSEYGFSLRHFSLQARNHSFFDFSNSSFNRVPSFLLQARLLYSDLYGGKRLRVSTILVPTTDSLAELASSYSPQLFSAYFVKAAFSSLKSSFSINLVGILNRKLANYQKALRAVTTEFHPHLGEAALNFLGLYKSILFNQGLTKDLKTEVLIGYRSMLSRVTTKEALSFVVPVLYDLSDLSSCCYQAEDGFILPPAVQLTASALDRDIYIMDVGPQLIIMLMRKQIGVRYFGHDFNPVGFSEAKLRQSTTEEAVQVLALVNQLRSFRYNWYAKLSFGLKGRAGPVEQRFWRGLLVDPHSVKYDAGYYQLLEQLSKL